MSLVTTPVSALVACRSCGSRRTTSIRMTLTDGTPVDFVSCHRCEQRTWVGRDGGDLPREVVLDRARKPRPALPLQRH